MHNNPCMLALNIYYQKANIFDIRSSVTNLINVFERKPSPKPVNNNFPTFFCRPLTQLPGKTFNRPSLMDSGEGSIPLVPLKKARGTNYILMFNVLILPAHLKHQ